MKSPEEWANTFFQETAAAAFHGSLSVESRRKQIESLCERIRAEALEAAAGACTVFCAAHSDHCNSLCHYNDADAIRSLNRETTP